MTTQPALRPSERLNWAHGCDILSHGICRRTIVQSQIHHLQLQIAGQLPTKEPQPCNEHLISKQPSDLSC